MTAPADLAAALAALRALYNVACHHPKCERNPTNGIALSCSCGVSSALQGARVVLGITPGAVLGGSAALGDL